MPTSEEARRPRTRPQSCFGLSVVVITRNQGWNINRLLASVSREVAAAKVSAQVIVVDSDSSDDTVQRAIQSEAVVIALDPGQRLSAAMGRYVGHGHSTGEFILFLDGDAELWPGWLVSALRFMRSTPGVAGMSGDRLFVPESCPDGLSTGAPERPVLGAIHEVQFVSGLASLYRRQALDQVGGFNPYLFSDEEPDLGIRLRARGYRLVRSEGYSGVHYGDEPTKISTVFHRRRRRLYHGAGQCLRFRWRSRLLWYYLKERGFWIAPAVTIVAMVALAAAVYSGSETTAWSLALLLAAGAGLVALSISKRGLYATAFSVIVRLAMLEGAIRGFFLPTRSPADEPVKSRIVKSPGNAKPQSGRRHGWGQ